MSIDSSIADLLQGSSGKTATWKNVGDTVSVVIESIERRQERDFDTGTPLTWDDGNPRLQFVITGKAPVTGEPVTIYTKYAQEKVMLETLRKTGLPEVGGVLAFTWTGNAEPVGRKNPAKQWGCSYTPPSPIAMTAEDLF
jgi:hypothetical protein